MLKRVQVAKRMAPQLLAEYLGTAERFYAAVGYRRPVLSSY
jgi:hypothetical protein